MAMCKFNFQENKKNYIIVGLNLFFLFYFMSVLVAVDLSKTSKDIVSFSNVAILLKKGS